MRANKSTDNGANKDTNKDTNGVESGSLLILS